MDDSTGASEGGDSVVSRERPLEDSLHRAAAPEEATIAPPVARAAATAATPKRLSGEEATERVHAWIKADKWKSEPETAAVLMTVVKDHDALKEKISKLKSLLGRSAKAQREAKVDLDATQKKLEAALREVERLALKLDKLANRPTHMELLADFETNFDRALLSVGNSQQQVGGEETAPATAGSSSSAAAAAALEQEAAVVDQMLLQELNDSRARVEKLESLNAALLHRSTHLESEGKERRRAWDELSAKVSRLDLEKRMAVMEADHATKAMHEKAASLAEMQMEIDLVTRASMNANVRAAHGEEMIKTVKTDKKRVSELEAQVQALQEWALASSEAKTLAQERVHLLETQLRSLQHGNAANTPTGQERILASYGGSMVVGAGAVGSYVIALDHQVVQEAKSAEHVVLRWHFDLNTEDLSIDFSLLQGNCDTKAKQKEAETFIDKRIVKGGAEGDQEYAFSVDNSCTMLFSNAKSWVRPRTVRYKISLLVLSH
jgi:hypothetical protein